MIENCIRYLLLCNKLPPNLAVLHNKHLFSTLFLWLRIQEKRSLVVSGSGTCVRLQPFFWPALQSNEGFNGAGGSPSKTALSHGCWQEASGPSHANLSLWLLEWPHGMGLASFTDSDQRERAEVKPQWLLRPSF